MKKQSVMRLAFILWAGFIMQTASYAQDQPGLDMLMTSKAPYCETVALNCSEQYISFFREHNYDSCHIVLEYWESKCSMTEPLQRAIILLAIAEDRFSDDLYNENIINYTDNFSSRILYTSGGNQLAYFSQSKAYFGYIPIDAGFDRFTKEQAEHLSEETDKNSTAYPVSYTHLPKNSSTSGSSFARSSR